MCLKYKLVNQQKIREKINQNNLDLTMEHMMMKIIENFNIFRNMDLIYHIYSISIILVEMFLFSLTLMFRF